MAFNRKQKLRDNIEAIRTAFILDREQRTATTEERAILQRYCGFGGLKCILNPAKELTDAVRWAKSDLELFAPTVELHRLIRENSKDETEYKRFVDSLKASVLTAFYTPKEITDTIADVLADYSVRPARMLEPSAGVGVFVDSMLRHNPNADVMAFEKDLLTGTILRHLYPDKKTRTCGFEKIERPFNNYFDLAVSNIPFGDIAVFDAEFERSDSFGRRSAQKAIHNYFFLKGLDTVRDGGIVAFITSQGVLNSTKTSVRNEMFSQADLVSAIRLPNNLFTDNAGTEVGSDLIVLQKNLNKKEMSQDERLMTVIQTDTKTDLTDNAYFIHHPERIVHTTAKLDTDPYGKPAMVYLHEGKTAGIAGDLRRMLNEDFHYRLVMRLYSGTIRQSGTEEKVAVQKEMERPAIKLETAPSAQAVETPTEKPQPVEEKPEIEPRPKYSDGVQLSLLDLWGMTEEVCQQPKTAKKKKAAKKESPARRIPSKPQVQTTQNVTENKEAKADSAIKPADPDDIYAKLDWETNPPINGFYEMMMGLTPERRKELRELARQHNEKQENRTAVTVTPEVPREQPRQEEIQPVIAATPAATDAQSEAVATSLFPDIEAEKPKEEVVDLSPRAYHRTPEMHLREGSLVTDWGRHNIG
ncbi:N-6 DNA methylase, partial [Bacteroides caccae]